MAQKDKYHPTVQIALHEAGYILEGSLFLPVDFGVLWTVDIAAVAPLGEAEKIAVEVKNFEDSFSNEFHKARGQYENYRRLITEQVPEYTLWLALPEAAYNYIRSQPVFSLLAEEAKFQYLVFDPATQSIVQWIKA